MIDGLYISNVWVCPAECALTFQGNDLTKPDQRTASYSNSFTLPDSLTVRDLTQGAEQLDAGGPIPYRQLPAKVIDDGEVIFSGIAEFFSFKAGWKVNLMDSVVSFFDAIKDKNLSDLDLSAYDHPWTLDYISRIAGAPEGIVYPLIDYGGIDAGVTPYDTMCPAIYAKTLFGQICKETGYKPVGDWLTDPVFSQAALPFVGSDPKSHEQDWVDDRSARVTTQNGDPIVLKNGHPINILLPLSNDALPLQGFQQGKLKPFRTDRNVYVVPQNMRVIVQAQLLFTSINRYGAAEVEFKLLRNGNEVPNAKAYWSKGGNFDHLDTPDTLTIDTSVDCVKGDELSLQLTGSSRTSYSSYGYYFSQIPGETWANFRPDASVHLGDLWPVAPNMPDLTCKDLVLSLAKAMSGTFDVDNVRRTIKLTRLDDVVKNLPKAKDWSANVDTGEEPELTTQIEPYSKKNALKWKEADEKENLGYGDGLILCENSPNPEVKTLFDLPFAATVQSVNSVGTYGFPLLIKTRSISVSGDSTTVNKNDADPRLILIEPTKAVVVRTKVMNVDGVLEEQPVTLTACWFAIRPDGAKTDSNAFSLAFSPVMGQSEESLIVRYFKALRRVLRRPRMLDQPVYLQPSDVANLDLSIPIRLQRVRAGSLDINDSYFYLNNLNSYRSGRTCKATLIAL